MTFLTDLTHNIIFMSAITGWFVAQVLKTLIPQQYVHLQRQPGSGMVAEALNLHWRRSLQLW